MLPDLGWEYPHESGRLLPRERREPAVFMAKMAGGDAQQQIRALSWQERTLSTKHPHFFYWWAGLEAFVFAVLGAAMMSRTVGAGATTIVIGMLAAALTASPGWWSERHPQEAAHAVDVKVRVRNRAARRHPMYFVVVIPLVCAADGVLRWNQNNGNRGGGSWLIPAAVGLVIGLVVGVSMIVRARKAGAVGVA